MTYSVHTKVSWLQTVSSNWEDFFYPSLVKKIKKSSDYFESLFEFKVSNILEVSDVDNFFDLYNKEIASRGNYIFKENEQKEQLDGKVQNGKKYIHAGIYKKDNRRYCGGVIFSIIENRLSFALRVFDKEIRNEYRALTTIDFWAEKKMYEYAHSQNLEFISHGTDNYPNKGRTGLILFKLKVGGKPKISKKHHEVIELTEEEITNYDATTFFWTNADDNGFFRKAYLFYKSRSMDESVLSELIKVTAWAGIELELKEL